MAEEDDARIRILQSLRGKICKSADLLVSQVGRTSELREGKPEGRGMLSTVDRVEAETASSSARAAG